MVEKKSSQLKVRQKYPNSTKLFKLLVLLPEILKN